MADLLVEHDLPVVRLTLNRPDQRNPLSLSLMQALIRSLTEMPSSTQVVVIAARGPVFSAGHDLSEMTNRSDQFYQELFDTCTVLMETIQRLPQPVIAQVQGTATAGGCQLVAACDLAVVAEEAKFATPGVKIGLFCSTPMVPISRAVGRKRAMEMLLTGEPIDSFTAQQWGLVNRVVPADRLEKTVDQMIAQITKHSPKVVGIGKGAFYRQLDLGEPQAYEYTKQVMAANAADDQAQEGIAAFLEKRSPVWPD